MPVDCYAATRTQQGRTLNEDAYLIGRGAIPFAALCDGAGNAEQAAKRVLTLFERVFREAPPDEVLSFTTWAKWVKLLDSSLLGGSQSTFLAVALIDSLAVGACAGDSRAYLINREGEGRILTEGASKFRLGSGKAEAFPLREALASGDTLLLLTDGAWTPLSPYLLKKAVLGVAGHFSDVAMTVLDAAGRTGRADDMTAIAVRVRN